MSQQSEDLEIGVLFNTDRMSGADFVDYAKKIEATGIDSLWLAELFGREPFAASGLVLANTSTLRVGTAIANIYARDAVASAAASATLAEISGNRFELGLGVSNAGLNERRGHTWTAPAPRLQEYLQTVRTIKLDVGSSKNADDTSYPIYVAAHGPKMLEVAASGADGVFTYLMNSEHTATTRSGLPETSGLSPMMMCLLCTDPDEARRLARKAIAYYTGLDYYHRAWRLLGFNDDDFRDGGSDNLVDTIVAWGSMEDIKARLETQHQAGANRVVVIPLNPAGGGQPDWELLSNLAH